MNHTHANPGIDLSRKRSWLMTFSDILMQLLAFFIMRLAIAPYRLGAILPQEKPGLTGASSETAEDLNVKQLQYLRFHRVDSTNTIEANISARLLPEREEDMSFTLKEEIMTLASTFGAGDYVFTVSEHHCIHSEQSQAATAFLVGELLATGVPLECLQVGNKNTPPQTCTNTDSLEDTRRSTLTISISQKKCDPFA